MKLSLFLFAVSYLFASVIKADHVVVTIVENYFVTVTYDVNRQAIAEPTASMSGSEGTGTANYNRDTHSDGLVMEDEKDNDGRVNAMMDQVLTISGKVTTISKSATATSTAISTSNASAYNLSMALGTFLLATALACLTL